MCTKPVILALSMLAGLQFAADDGYILRKNHRTLEQIDAVYSQMQPIRYVAPPDRWENLPRTKQLLAGGGALRVVMLGDSIINDTSRSAWDLVLQRRYPACRIEKVTSVRGSTGCWWYKEPTRVQKFVLDHKPDLVIIGGISQRDDIESIAEVIRQIRADANPDILLTTGVFGRVNPNDDKQWQRISNPAHHSKYRKALEELAQQTGAAFLDMELPWAEYIRESDKNLDWFKRDVVHANERGEQILGRILAQYLSPVLDKPENSQGRKLGSSMPWDTEVLFRPPQQYEAPGFESPGVEAVFYEGLPRKGKPTRVFAWYGIPKPKSGERLPAMVLVHGGGGTAFSDWVRLWTGRGYAAIAMDTCGCVPRGKYGNWQRHDKGGPSGWGGFDMIDQPLADQWTYHAVADAILAHSLIRTFPQVDPDRIGITGISWGGYLTCIVAGVDHRFRLAVPVYGCGFLGDNSTWLGTFKKMGEEKSAKWLSLWDPSVYLPRASMPFLWVTGTNDFAYPMDSLQKSYRLPKAPHTLCVTVRMPHGHGGAGENPAEIKYFADSILKAGKPLPEVTAQGLEAGKAWATYTPEVPVDKAELTFTTDSGPWQKRLWKTAPAKIDPESKRVSADLPEATTVFYLNIFDARGAAVSTEHVEVSMSN